MKHELKSEHMCAHTHTHTHTLAWHCCQITGPAWEIWVCDMGAFNNSEQKSRGRIGDVLWGHCLQGDAEGRMQRGGFQQSKEKSMLWVATNKPLLSGLTQGWLLYLGGQSSIEGLLLLYKRSVFLFSWGRGQGLSTWPCTHHRKWWRE